MPVIITPAIVLATIRYSETSKIVRLATREHGVQSAIAKGALRPRSRFGAALQLLSDGVAHLVMKEHRDLHLLTAFDVSRVRIGLAEQLERYTAASTLSEVMLRFAPPDPHPDSFDLLRDALDLLERVDESAVESTALRLLWALVSSLGFSPSLAECVRDGTPLDPTGPLAFSTREGGALCPVCARQHAATTLPADARADLDALLDLDAPVPSLDTRHASAHRRLVSRFIRFHLGEGAVLPALDFWERRPWVAG